MKKNTRKILLAIICIFFIILIIFINFQQKNIALVRWHSDLIINEKHLWLFKVKGMSDKAIQQKLNENIQIDMRSYLEDCIEDSVLLKTGRLYSGVIEEKYLYISFEVKFGQADSYSYYNVVYNLETGERVGLEDLFDLNDSFIAALQLYGKDYSCKRGDALVTFPGYEYASEEFIERALSRITMEQNEWNELAEEIGIKSYNKPDFLITEENLYLSVPIPLDKLEDYLKVPKWW